MLGLSLSLLALAYTRPSSNAPARSHRHRPKQQVGPMERRKWICLLKISCWRQWRWSWAFTVWCKNEKRNGEEEREEGEFWTKFRVHSSKSSLWNSVFVLAAIEFKISISSSELCKLPSLAYQIQLLQLLNRMPTRQPDQYSAGQPWLADQSYPIPSQ